MRASIRKNDTSPSFDVPADSQPTAAAQKFAHPCGHESSWGRCELRDPVDKLAALWGGVAEIVPAADGIAEHLHPFQYCGGAEQTAVDIWAHHSLSATAHLARLVLLIRRDRPASGGRRRCDRSGTLCRTGSIAFFQRASLSLSQKEMHRCSLVLLPTWP